MFSPGAMAPSFPSATVLALAPKWGDARAYLSPLGHPKCRSTAPGPEVNEAL